MQQDCGQTVRNAPLLVCKLQQTRANSALLRFWQTIIPDHSSPQPILPQQKGFCPDNIELSSAADHVQRPKFLTGSDSQF